jgi:hypothetical protein
MGTLNWKITVCLANGRSSETGSNSFGEAMKNANSIAAHQGTHLVKAELFPQTARARKQCLKDFIILDCEGKADHYSIGQPIPLYCF